VVAESRRHGVRAAGRASDEPQSGHLKSHRNDQQRHERTASKFRHLPVVEDGQLISILSIGHVVKCRVQQIEFESAALCDYTRST
jgi:hypothetical protein